MKTEQIEYNGQFWTRVWIDASREVPEGEWPPYAVPIGMEDEMPYVDLPDRVDDPVAFVGFDRSGKIAYLMYSGEVA